jgi:hypothetical protein
LWFIGGFLYGSVCKAQTLRMKASSASLTSDAL